MIRMLVTLCMTLTVCAGCGEKGTRPSPSAPSNQEQAYIDQGNARADQGDLAGAIADYTQALTFDPQYANAYYNRGGAHATEGDKAGAVADFRKAADLYQQQGKTADYQDTLNRIKELQ